MDLLCSLKYIHLNWGQICAVCSGVDASLQDFLSKYEQVFQDGLGRYEGYKAHLEVDPTATPQFSKARTLPYSMRKGVEEELNCLVQEGTLEPMEYSDWATPIVAVLKSNKKSICICGDFRMMVNPILKLDRYPILRTEDLFATLQGGKKFTYVARPQPSIPAANRNTS